MDLNNNNSVTIKIGWIYNITDIVPGKSAILSGNKLSFYGIHGISIILVLISLISCITVILTIYRETKKRRKWDFSDRFPLYMAIADGLWCISNLSGDQLILLVHTEFPSKSIATLLALNVAFFFGYQQIMNAGLSLYTYLKVVRRVSIDLGHLEWKLHSFSIVFMIAYLGAFYPLDAYGCSGFWFFMDFNTKGGLILTTVVCTFSTFHAISTLVAYRSIQEVIRQQRRKTLPSTCDTSISQFECNNDKKRFNQTSYDDDDDTKHKHYHSTATNCLTTFIYISICLYFPFAIASWALFIESLFGFLETFTLLLIVLGANSGGWVNAWGYFHNRKIKRDRRNAIAKRTLVCPHASSSSNSNNVC